MGTSFGRAHQRHINCYVTPQVEVLPVDSTGVLTLSQSGVADQCMPCIWCAAGLFPVASG